MATIMSVARRLPSPTACCRSVSHASAPGVLRWQCCARWRDPAPWPGPPARASLAQGRVRRVRQARLRPLAVVVAAKAMAPEEAVRQSPRDIADRAPRPIVRLRARAHLRSAHQDDFRLRRADHRQRASTAAGTRGRPRGTLEGRRSRRECTLKCHCRLRIGSSRSAAPRRSRQGSPACLPDRRTVSIGR